MAESETPALFDFLLFKKAESLLCFMFLKAHSLLEDLIWSYSNKSRAAHQLKRISSTQKKEEPFTPCPNFVFLVGNQANRATGASSEPLSP